MFESTVLASHWRVLAAHCCHDAAGQNAPLSFAHVSPREQCKLHESSMPQRPKTKKRCRYTQVKFTSEIKAAWFQHGSPVPAVEISSWGQPPPALFQRNFQNCAVQAYRLELPRQCDALLPPLHAPNFRDFPAADAFLCFPHRNAIVAGTPDKEKAFCDKLKQLFRKLTTGAYLVESRY